MAKVNVDAVPAGPELDALTAERVFGWKEIHGEKHDPQGKRPDKLGRLRSARVPDFSTDPTYAHEIEDRMKDLGLFEPYTKELSRITRAKGVPTDWASPDQRCRAAIKASRKRRQPPGATT
jgi:hypothetical protein